MLPKLPPDTLPEHVGTLVREACGGALGTEVDGVMGPALCELVKGLKGSAGAAVAVWVVRAVAGLGEDDGWSAAAEALLAWLMPAGTSAPGALPEAGAGPEQRLQRAVQALGQQQQGSTEDKEQVARASRWALCQRLAAWLPCQCAPGDAAAAPRAAMHNRTFARHLAALQAEGRGGVAACLADALATLAALGRAADVRRCLQRAAAAWGGDGVTACEAVGAAAACAASLAGWLGGPNFVCTAASAGPSATAPAETSDSMHPAGTDAAAGWFAEAASACPCAVRELTQLSVQRAVTTKCGSVGLEGVLSMLQAAEAVGDRGLLVQAVAAVASAAVPASTEAARQLPQKLVQLGEDHGWAALQPGTEEAARKLLAHDGTGGGALGCLRLVDGVSAAAARAPPKQLAERSVVALRLTQVAVAGFTAQVAAPPPPATVPPPAAAPQRPGHASAAASMRQLQQRAAAASASDPRHCT